MNISTSGKLLDQFNLPEDFQELSVEDIREEVLQELWNVWQVMESKQRRLEEVIAKCNRTNDLNYLEEVRSYYSSIQ